MPDLGKVLEALKKCEEDSCKGCPYDGECSTRSFAMMRDAAELLAERETVKPVILGRRDWQMGGAWWYGCPECQAAIDKGDAYCRRCGRRLDWSE